MYVNSMCGFKIKKKNAPLRKVQLRVLTVFMRPNSTLLCPRTSRLVATISVVHDQRNVQHKPHHRCGQHHFAVHQAFRHCVPEGPQIVHKVFGLVEMCPQTFTRTMHQFWNVFRECLCCKIALSFVQWLVQRH